MCGMTMAIPDSSVCNDIAGLSDQTRKWSDEPIATGRAGRTSDEISVRSSRRRRSAVPIGWPERPVRTIYLATLVIALLAVWALYFSDLTSALTVAVSP